MFYALSVKPRSMDCSVDAPKELKMYATWQLTPTPTLYP